MYPCQVLNNLLVSMMDIPGGQAVHGELEQGRGFGGDATCY